MPPSTCFFRHPEQIALASAFALRRRPGRRGVRVWSAGCATGEEAYTLAILFLEAGLAPDDDRPPILATDVDAGALARAADGVFAEPSVAPVPARLRARHLERTADDTWRVLPEVRGLVDFSRHDLLSDPLPEPGFDLVVCRDVTVGFDPRRVRAAHARLASALAPGGHLLLGPAEIPTAALSGLGIVRHGDAYAYRRGPAAPARRDARAARDVSLGPRRPTPTGAAPAPPLAIAATAARSSDGPDAELAEARLRADRGDVAAAREVCRRVLEHTPLHAPAHLLLGLLAGGAGNRDEARRHLKKALYLDPDLAIAHLRLASLLAAQGRDAEARRHYSLALRIGRGWPAEVEVPHGGGLTAAELTAESREGLRRLGLDL